MKKDLVKEVIVEDMLMRIESAIKTFIARNPNVDFEKETTIQNIAQTVHSSINEGYGDTNRNTTVLRKLEERLKMGQLKYGQDIPVYDGRDWLKEGVEEVLDGLVYLTNYLLRLDEMKIETGFKSEEDKINEKL